MALNYNNQFNYTGKGFVDSKMNPFATKDDLLKLSSADLLASYVPGMSVWVLEDGQDTLSQYVLNNEYQLETY